MDHWFAPVKRRSELGFSCLLHCSTSHAIITVHQNLAMLNVYLLWTSAHQTWRCCRRGMQVSGPAASNLVSRFDKLYYQVSWTLSHTVALNGHRCSRGDIPSLTWWMSKICFDQPWFPRLVWTRDLEGSSDWIWFSEKWIEDGFNWTISYVFETICSVLTVTTVKWSIFMMTEARWQIPDIFVLSGR